MKQSRTYLNVALIQAVCHGDTETVKVLVALGADPHVGHEEPLRLAAFMGNTETAKVLVDSGANIGAALGFAAGLPDFEAGRPGVREKMVANLVTIFPGSVAATTLRKAMSRLPPSPAP